MVERAHGDSVPVKPNPSGAHGAEALIILPRPPIPRHTPYLQRRPAGNYAELSRPYCAQALQSHQPVADTDVAVQFHGLAGPGIYSGRVLAGLPAHELDHAEQEESAFYTRKAVQSLEKSLRVTVKDYAFWSDAYKHLHMQVDTDWAYTRGNVGPTMYEDFGFQGLFVVNDDNRTVYSVIKGELVNHRSLAVARPTPDRDYRAGARRG